MADLDEEKKTTSVGNEAEVKAPQKGALETPVEETEEEDAEETPGEAKPEDEKVQE